MEWYNDKKNNPYKKQGGATVVNQLGGYTYNQNVYQFNDINKEIHNLCENTKSAWFINPSNYKKFETNTTITDHWDKMLYFGETDDEPCARAIKPEKGEG